MSSGKAYGLLSSFAGKAQGFLGGSSSTGAPPAEGQSAAQGQAQGQYAAPVQEQSGTLSGRHPGLEALSHQIRSVKAQYSSVFFLITRPISHARCRGGSTLIDRTYSDYNRSGVSQENHQLQLIITAQKGVSLDFDAAGRDAKTQSKELYLWGQSQDDGIKGESIPLDLGNGSDTNN